MPAYPVRYVAQKPSAFSRAQLVLRVLAFIVIGIVGISIGMVLAVAYLALPAFAAARNASSKTEGASYLQRDAPQIRRGLSWFAAIFAWLGLVTERPPMRSPEEAVRVRIDDATAGATEPAPADALMRIITGLPSALALAVLYFVGSFVWLWSAVRILVQEQVGDVAYDYLVGVQRWTMRLLAYQACLVEPYPPFSFEDEAPRDEVTTAA